MTKCLMCGKCCQYISIAIDEPEDHDDYDEIVWYLMHHNIRVYIDDDEDWYVEVRTDCKALGEDGLCQMYEERPTVCREHDPEECENNGEGSPYNILFENRDDFISYLKLKGIKYVPGKRDA
ncbi:MAG: YkgJ family cysteine cluster protein [Candidatus Woesearchaeota archaeon]